MTCIIGYKDKNGVTIGGDSLGSNYATKTVRKDPKVFKVGEFIIGTSGSYRVAQVLEFSLILPDIGRKGLFRYMCTDFISAVLECLKKGDVGTITEGVLSMEGSFIVAHKKRLFTVFSDLQVAECVVPYTSIGSGRQVALGSLFTNKTCTIEKRITTALRAAAYHARGVEGPFKLLSTKEK